MITGVKELLKKKEEWMILMLVDRCSLLYKKRLNKIKNCKINFKKIKICMILNKSCQILQQLQRRDLLKDFYL